MWCRRDGVCGAGYDLSRDKVHPWARAKAATVLPAPCNAKSRVWYIKLQKYPSTNGQLSDAKMAHAACAASNMMPFESTVIKMY